MINLKTNCEDCIHVKVCKNKDSSKRFLEKLTKVRDDCDYDCENLSYQYNVNVDISCPDFEKRPTTLLRGFSDKKAMEVEDIGCM